ncbi:rhodanese-like domain-containing protein [Bifidobacterium miconisargentati]|uniref:rhodanese-like domain-containing protein n=1 Tax=Bifidobacterium miconisargentati TaxID=2834437 RepID=UPI001BDD5240|nr:rhodanese-like domain-containing protein [Bifidobacterium miconisargentati]MBW3089321.1 rhodanese-like domain-containing protein [Bifidobacterium miconisargentati]
MMIAVRIGKDVEETDEPSFGRITPEEFAALDPDTVTLLDLREPADVAAHPVEGAINAPLDPLAHVLRTVPKDRKVVVYCAEGWWSEEVAEILADRGYEVASLIGGFRAYQQYLDGQAAR